MPLLRGYEGVPTHPDPGRPWRIAEVLGVNIFHTSPRALRRAGPDEPAKYRCHFKHMTTVGEPIEPEVWKWYYNTVGKGEAVIVDTWWETETGGFLCSTVPGIHPMKPGSTGPAIPGIHPVIYDEDGKELASGSGKAGNICIRNPWPGAFQTIWKDPERYVRQYYSRYCKDTNSKVSASVVSEIGAIARPRNVIIVPDMPKTRSGKIMRRVLAAISSGQDPGDVSTLANPEVVDMIKGLAK